MNRPLEWTLERLTVLDGLIAQGLTYHQAGAIMGITRNTVAGVIHRHGSAKKRTLDRPNRIVAAIASLTKERPGRYIGNQEIAERAGLPCDRDISYMLTQLTRAGRIIRKGSGRSRTICVVNIAAPDIRSCLKCGNPFQSAGSHNRLCDYCRNYAANHTSALDMESYGNGHNGHRAGAGGAE